MSQPRFLLLHHQFALLYLSFFLLQLTPGYAPWQREALPDKGYSDALRAATVPLLKILRILVGEVPWF